MIEKLKWHFTRYGILGMVFPTVIFQFTLAFRTCRTLPAFLSENLHKNGQVIVQNTNRLFSDYLFSISGVQEYCFPRVPVRKNPFTNKKRHKMSKKIEWGRREE